MATPDVDNVRLTESRFRRHLHLASLPALTVDMQKTRSEIVFERWLDANRLPWHRIQTGPGKTPDYAVMVAPGAEIIFEVKQIQTNRRWKDDIVHGGEVAAHIRSRINSSKSQIQSTAKLGKPTVLVVFNAYDPLQLSGTEDHDFMDAMYGAYTVQIDIESRMIVERFRGQGKSFQANKNTSFSAIARLKDESAPVRLKEESGPDSVTLFENIHAAMPIDYSALPPCFEVVRFDAPSGANCSSDEDRASAL